MKKLERKIVAKKSLKEVESEYIEATPEERISMVWEITCDTWAFMSDTNVERRLQRNITAVIRRRR
ncbi:MAG TPA: hypothetical protein PL059_05295 [Spirochaetota bacterium]|nr:hypothetical protein [Spirochaetota bacterium]HOM09280.1 hypothetical protein [Spirochaetota bacterium]HPP49293.1 hypothetical protein [Spirochaetota bacterium]